MSSTFPAPDLCSEDASTGDIGQDHNNVGALTPNALDQYLRKRKFQACCKWIIVNTIQNNCYRDWHICKISRTNVAQGKEIKLDSNETVVSKCAYLPVVRDIEVISYRWVFCCQCVDLYGEEEEGLWLGQCQIFLTCRCSGVFLFPSFLFYSYSCPIIFQSCLSSKGGDLNCHMLATQHTPSLPPDLTVPSTAESPISF